MATPRYDSGWDERADLPCRVCGTPLQKRVLHFDGEPPIRILYRHGGEGGAATQYIPDEGPEQYRAFEARAHGLDAATVPRYRVGWPGTREG